MKNKGPSIQAKGKWTKENKYPPINDAIKVFMIAAKYNTTCMTPKIIVTLLTPNLSVIFSNFNLD
jgi:hypothetical protein